MMILLLVLTLFVLGQQKKMEAAEMLNIRFGQNLDK